MCVCVYVCLSSRLKKINTTGVASVKPGKARESIVVANLRQFFAKWSSPNEVSPNEVRQIKFRQIKKVLAKKNVKKKKKSFVKNVKKKFQYKKFVQKNINQILGA